MILFFGAKVLDQWMLKLSAAVSINSICQTVLKDVVYKQGKTATS